jgi:hypothetical protein
MNTLSTQADVEFKELERLSRMTAAERFKLSEESGRLVPSVEMTVIPISMLVPELKPVPAFQDKERREQVAVAVHAEQHTCRKRGGYKVSARDETTELLFHIFTAARHPNTVHRVRDRYEIEVSSKLDEAEEELLYLLLTVGNRLVAGDEKIVAASPALILEKRGVVKCSKNRDDAKASLRKLFKATIFVKDLKTGWEDGIRLIRRIRVDNPKEMNKIFDVVLSDDLLSLYDEPAFPALLETRCKLKVKDAANIAAILQFRKDYKNGIPVTFSKEELIRDARCYRLAQYSPKKTVARIIADLAGIGIACQHSKNYVEFTFEKMPVR